MSSLSTSTETCLSKGVIQSNLNAGVLPPNERAVFKVLGLKTLNPNGGNNESNVKVRLAISDGQDKFVKALLIFPRENPPVLPKKDDIVDLRNPIGQNPTNAVTTVNGSHVFLVHNFRILDKEAVIRLTQSTVSVDTPSTPSSTASSSSNNVAPPTPAKRPGSPLASGSNDPRPNPAKRNLFDRPRSAAMPLAKTTHRIEDLNPYQNKYTICARVTSIEPIKEISNSRWSGSVFSVVFEDESGDIKASGFNDFATKFHPLLKEGESYYLTNAQVKPIHNPTYNKTSHKYELSLNQNTIINECHIAMNKPKLKLNLVKLVDIQEKGDKESVDVIGVCKHVKDLFEGTSRAGKGYKKRDATLIDETGEVPLTIWGEKAEQFQGEGKIIAIKTATVSEWNGKSLSTGFSGTIEIEPDIPQTTTLRTWFDNHYVPSSSASNGASSRTTGDSAVTTLKEIKLEYQAGGAGDDTARYFTIDTYVTNIQADRMAYKACPTENCRRKLEENGNSYRCKKCQITTDQFEYRYILRGVLADCTDYEWFAAFDDAAQELMEAPAKELMSLQENNPRSFGKKIDGAKFKRLLAKVRCKNEIYNEEKRLKLTLISSTVVKAGSVEHQERVRKAIDDMERCLAIN